MVEGLLKVRVTYDTGSSTYEAFSICSAAVFESIIDQWKDISNSFVEWSGRLNDIDSNVSRIVIRRDAIVAIDGMEVNGIV